MTMTVIGGTLIGLGAGALLLIEGRIAGVSGILAGGLQPGIPDRAWRWLFVAGLVVGGIVGGAMVPGALPGSYVGSPARLVAAGGLIGIGARVANGCTSGHGLCGVARGSARSLVAVAIFVACGAATVLVGRWLGGAR
jgi:uncharacterized membrane protein YedE/YeeE